MRRVRSVFAACAVFGAVPAMAQAPGLPVVNAGVARGLTLAGMLGFPNGGAGDGTGYAASLAAGFRRVALVGFVSGVKNGAFKDHYAAGGNLVIKVAGGPLVPIAINLQGGLAYSRPKLAGFSERHTEWRVPLGLGISWTIPRPVVALKPWIAPRLDHLRLTVPATTGAARSTGTATKFGLSGGINFGFLNGLGIDVAVDRLFATGSKPTTVGVGLSYTFK